MTHEVKLRNEREEVYEMSAENYEIIKRERKKES